MGEVDTCSYSFPNILIKIQFSLPETKLLKVFFLLLLNFKKLRGFFVVVVVFLLYLLCYFCPSTNFNVHCILKSI